MGPTDRFGPIRTPGPDWGTLKYLIKEKMNPWAPLRLPWPGGAKGGQQVLQFLLWFEGFGQGVTLWGPVQLPWRRGWFLFIPSVGCFSSFHLFATLMCTPNSPGETFLPYRLPRLVLVLFSTLVSQRGNGGTEREGALQDSLSRRWIVALQTVHLSISLMYPSLPTSSASMSTTLIILS